MSMAEQKGYQASTAGGGIGSYRTSREVSLGYEDMQNSAFLTKFNTTIHSKLGIDPKCHLGWNINRYTPNQQYLYHMDDEYKLSPQLNGCNPGRVKTLLICLKACELGGETHFPHLGVKVKLNQGDALLFSYFEKGDVEADKPTLHAGLSVTKGEKVIANMFVHDGPLAYKYSGDELVCLQKTVGQLDHELSYYLGTSARTK